MKFAIVGSRTFDDYSLMRLTLDNYEISEIISGGAKGADSLAEKYAKEKKIPLTVFPAEWEKHGRSAGFLRNELIIKNADFVVAFWDGKSKGTEHSLSLANKQNKIVRIVKF